MGQSRVTETKPDIYTIETPQKIRNTPKDSKHPKIFVIQVLLNKKIGNIITIIKFANEVQ
jgi:hypothetical protein